MRRADIWTAAAGSGYAGEARPVVIIQDDRFDATESVTVCAFTTDPTESPLIRIRTACGSRAAPLGRAVVVFFGLAGN